MGCKESIKVQAFSKSLKQIIPFAKSPLEVRDKWFKIKELFDSIYLLIFLNENDFENDLKLKKFICYLYS